MTDDSRSIPHPPYDELRNELGDDPDAARALDDLHATLHAGDPAPANVQRQVDVLRGIRNLEARIANWFDDPVTQRWFKSLSDTGL